MKFDKLLKNKYLHYLALGLMVINILGYVAMSSIECILAFGGAAYLANHFTKNRTVDIFIGLFVANILFGCGRLKEGYENATSSGKDKLMEAAQALNQEASHDKKVSSQCPAGQEKDATGKCAAVKESMAEAAQHMAKTADHEDKKKHAAKERFGF